MTNEERDRTKPRSGESWTFDADVTKVFPDMLRRSIPGYEEMRTVVEEIGSRFVVDKRWIVSVGCSRGDDMAPFVDRFGVRAHHLGLEVSEPMLEVSRARFSGMIDAGYLEIRKHDLRRDRYPRTPACLTLAILTVQFVPVEYRARLLRDIYRSTIGGGALILVEKVLASDATADDLLVSTYHSRKEANGYSRDEIEAKRRSLEGVLVPMTANENERALRSAGFETVEGIWRSLNFAAWVAIRSEDGAA